MKTAYNGYPARRDLIWPLLFLFKRLDTEVWMDESAVHGGAELETTPVFAILNLCASKRRPIYPVLHPAFTLPSPRWHAGMNLGHKRASVGHKGIRAWQSGNQTAGQALTSPPLTGHSPLHFVHLAIHNVQASLKQRLRSRLVLRISPQRISGAYAARGCAMAPATQQIHSRGSLICQSIV
ncbi:hypothetical protein P154DRAFT_576984 [Amniculicola lignicola CBS 123094]|uniref:Uncharacterized protein n=1 Tax=Amniculicola lignicola CBS 123094 TaxID=1392246 RepID=A0A6A5WCC8_9PLEO|nr:hypothetical protein P154DRAFT_576984 [Amniculicola lignicola CBS 123094]